MREDERDRVSRLGSEAWKRLKSTKDYHDWIKVGEALLVGREWAMNQAGTNKPEGKGYNMCFSEYLQRYKLDDMDKGDRSRLFQMMDALPQIEEWRRALTLTERLKLNHPNAVLRKFKAAFEVPDPSKPAKPGLRDSVAELSEENAQLKTENAQLKVHVAEVEASKELATVNLPFLLWVGRTVGAGCRRIQAPTVGVIYDIQPQLADKKRGRAALCVGFEVRYVKRRDDIEDGDDPDYADDEDIRIVKTGAQTEAEAKAIAQADFVQERE